MTRPTLRHHRYLVPVLILFLGAGAAAAATLAVTGPAGGTLAVDGHRLGSLPLAQPLELGRGTYTVTFTAPGYHDFSQTVVLADDADWVYLRIRPERIQRSHAVTNNLVFAGLGQMSMGARWRGWIYAAAEAGGLVTAAISESQRQTYRDDYILYKAEYDGTIDPDVLDHYHALSNQAYQDMQDATNLRNTGLLVAAGAIAVSMLDAFLLFPHADVGPGPVPPVAAAVGDGGYERGVGIHAGVSLAF